MKQSIYKHYFSCLFLYINRLGGLNLSIRIKMLNASAFIQTFQGFITRGVSNVFLCNKDGALLCAANNIDSIKPTAAIMSTIWCDY